MTKGLQAALYATAALAALLGAWGILSNAALPLILAREEDPASLDFHASRFALAASLKLAKTRVFSIASLIVAMTGR